MKGKRDTRVEGNDHWPVAWLVIATILGFLWKVPLTFWLVPIFYIRFMRRTRVWIGFLLVWLSLSLTMAVSLYGIMDAMMPAPLPIYIVTTMVGALVLSAPTYLADRLLTHRLPGFASTLVFPLAATALDYLSAQANPFGGIGATGYFQYGNLALMQLLSITGLWGIAFLVSWLGPVVNWAWERSFSWPEIHRGATIYASVMVIVLLYGSARLGMAPNATRAVRAHGITEVDMRENWVELLRITREDGWEAMVETSRGYQDLYLQMTIREAEAGAELVHWPEMAVMVAAEEEPAFIARAQEIARKHGIYLAMGMGTRHQDDKPTEIKLLVLDPSGDVVLEHLKYSLNAIEGSEPGDGVLRTVDTPFGRLSGIICNDTNHQETITQAGRNGTEILLSPSMEYQAIDPVHAHMAIYRGIENGVTVVRQADNGLSFVSDPYGRIWGATDHWVGDERVMVTQVPVQSAFTIYPYIGDLFAWLAAVAFVALAVFALVRGKRHTALSAAGA